MRATKRSIEQKLWRAKDALRREERRSHMLLRHLEGAITLCDSIQEILISMHPEVDPTHVRATSDQLHAALKAMRASYEEKGGDATW